MAFLIKCLAIVLSYERTDQLVSVKEYVEIRPFRGVVSLIFSCERNSMYSRIKV